MKRDKSLDVAKGIAIILMVYGHLKYTEYNMDTLYSWIYSFHMPFFVYITGWLTQARTEKKLVRTWKKAVGIFVPYVIWNVIGYIILISLGLVRETQYEFTRGLLLGNNLNSNLPTWYLWAYFLISLFAIYILPLIDDVKKLVAVDVIAIILVFWIVTLPEMQIYFRWKATLALMPFFITGYLLKKIKFQLPWWMIPVCLYIGFKLGRVNAVRSQRYVTVGNGDICVPYLYLLSAFLTTLAVVEICKYIAKIPGSELIEVFGKHTLIILCTHWLLGKMFATQMEYGVELFTYVFLIECVFVGGMELYAVLRQRGEMLREGKEAKI